MIIDVLWGDSSGEKREARGEKRGARRGSGKVKSFFLLDMLGNYIRTKCVKNEIDVLINSTPMVLSLTALAAATTRCAYCNVIRDYGLL